MGGSWEGWGLSVELSWAVAVLALFGPWGRGRSLPVSGAELSEGGMGHTERGPSVPLSHGGSAAGPPGLRGAFLLWHMISRRSS